MYKRIIIPLFILIACFTGNHCFSQQLKKEIRPDQYRAVHWTLQDGLPSDATNVVIKDAKGFLWIGSSSYGELCRFDGVRFKKHFPDPHKRGENNFSGVLAFVEDSLNNIWIGTDKGLSRYDIKAETFSNFTTTIDSVNSNIPIIPFWATRSHVYCFESGYGFARYDIRSFKREALLSTPGKTVRNIPQPGYIIFDSASNCLWMLETISHNPERGELVSISLSGGKKEHYSWACSRDNVTHRHSAEAMQFDRKRNSIWINTGDGLIEFTLADKQFHHIDAFSEYIKLKGYERWVGIDIDSDGKIWLATHKGILIYDPITNEVQQAFSNPGLQKSVAEANLHVYCDRDGIVWTSNWMDYGIYQLLPFNSSVKRYATKPGMQDSLSSGKVWSIVPAAQGKLWVGTFEGLNILDPLTEGFEVLREKDLPGIKGKTIAPIYVDTVRQKAWLLAGSVDISKSYNMKLYEMDIKTRKCRKVIFRDGAKQFDSIAIDPRFVRRYKSGLLICTDHYGVFEIKEGSLYADLVVSLYKTGRHMYGGFELAEERLIFLKPYKILPNFNFEIKNGIWEKISHPLDSLDWEFMIYNEKDKTHWVSFKYKLVHYSSDFREIKTYSEEDGYTRQFFRMVLDNAGDLWFVNELGQVGRLEMRTGVITMLSETDGYYKKDVDWGVPFIKDSRGNLYFGTGYSKEGKGLDGIYPEKFVSASPSSVYFLSLAINQKPFPLSTGVNSLEELSLRYDQNTISIETGIIDFYTKGKNTLRYKLLREGKDEDWQYGPAYNTIRYDGLVPGNYKLIMQASNAGGEFNGPEKILLINVNPPFWQTWWFRILAAIFVIGSIYGFIQYRSRNLKKRNILLEKKVEERTNELNKSLSELKTAQDQLIHAEKMASLGELTSGIAHEIKNPLNFINNFSEINMELMTEMEEEHVPKMDENNKAEIDSIIKTLKKNSEKINHHGKRVDEIVKSMLQHSRLGNTNKEAVDINSLCDESLKLAYHGFKAKEKTFNAAFETRFDTDIPKIMAVPQDLGRVLLNLINNAFYTVNERKKKNPEASSYKPGVIVSTKKCENKIAITISDNGMGIPPKIISKIFQPFFTTKPTGEGTGLGLSMSYDIITKSHGGELHAKSTEGEGTDFEILLPIINSENKK